MNVMDLFDLTGQKAIVTGAARGLGEQMAIALAEAGADVALADKNLKTAEEAAQSIVKTGRTAMALKVDVTDEQEVEAMVADVKKKFGKIDIMINNAGIATVSPAEDLPKEDWDSVLDVNLTGVFLCARAAGREMIKQKSGNIINTASAAGFIVPWPQMHVHYNATKGGVVMLTKTLAVEWAKYNIRVNAIAPFTMKTPMVVDSRIYEKSLKTWQERCPMHRIGEPWEIKGVTVFLSSNASTYITGSTILVDGGYLAW